LLQAVGLFKHPLRGKHSFQQLVLASPPIGLGR
jgi:hypothetical protein